jgi:hypothetical protein
MSDLKEVGRIESTYLGYENHGSFIGQVCFDFDGTGQCIRACLDSDEVGPFVIGILRAVGVDKWEDLIGRRAIVYRDEPHGYIRALSNLNGTRFYRWGL